MSAGPHSKRVAGKTIRFTWTDGPTKGSAHDHVFGDDGRVAWQSSSGHGTMPKNEAEQVPYAAIDVGDDVCLVSYLSRSGYTLTVALEFNQGTVNGIASNATTWTPVAGAFEVIASSTPP